VGRTGKEATGRRHLETGSKEGKSASKMKRNEGQGTIFAATGNCRSLKKEGKIPDLHRQVSKTGKAREKGGKGGTICTD